MIVFQVNGERKESPVGWEEATVGMYQRLMGEIKEGDNAIKIFSILTGTEFTALWEQDSEELELAIYQATAFVFNSPQEFKQAPRPKTFFLGGKSVLIPEKLSRLTIGQNFLMRQAIAKAAKEGKPLETLLSLALAIYLQPIVDAGKFDFDRAKELEVDILAMNIFDVYPTAFFLLMRLQNSGKSGVSFLLKQHLRKVRNALTLPRQLAWNAFKVFTISFSLTSTPDSTDNSRGLSYRSLSTRSCLTSWHGKKLVNTTNDWTKSRNS